MRKHGPIALALALFACDEAAEDTDVANAALIECQPEASHLVRIEGGTFDMGSRDVYGYVTIAEQPGDPDSFGAPLEQIPPFMLEPGSAVFIPPEGAPSDLRDWWQYVPGANWKKPFGPDGPAAKPNEPVVHLGWEDMSAYAQWKGGRLPTEAEWEYAASAGAPDSADQPSSDEANTWQGVFPVVNEGADGFTGLSPVGCFKPNAFGLYDMGGNAWEITADFYRPGHDPSARVNPKGPSETEAYKGVDSGIPARVMKGGSFLCAPNYCRRYRPAARQGNDPGLGSSNVGFRLVYDTAPTPSDRK